MNPTTDTLLSILDIPSGAETTHDPHGALCAMFTICDALYWLDPNSVPADWQFSPGMAGGLDYGRCAKSRRDNDGECQVCGGECHAVLDLLVEAGVHDIAWPYGQGNDAAARAANVAGYAAERALIELGNELNKYAVLYQG